MTEGRVDQGGHQGYPGHPRARYHQQPAAVCDPQRLQHVDPQHPRGQEGGPGHLHVPGQHGPHEEPGNITKLVIVDPLGVK